MQCKWCGSERLESRGKSYQCKDCHKWTSKKDSREASSVKYGEDYINIVCSSPRIITREDVISHFQVDTNIWELKEFEVSTSEGYRKDRQVTWDVTDGTVTNGMVRDSGKLLIAPMYHTKSKFVKKVEQIKATRAFDSLVDQAKAFAPKYPKITYPKIKDGLMYEIALPDMQLGRMVMASATGMDSDLTPECMITRADRMVDTLIGMVEHYPIEEILFPVGNDFYDSDNIQMTTMHGTPQSDDPRWQKVFDMGIELVRRTTDKLSALAPVKLVIIPGNHDETKAYYMGRELYAWYHHCPNVKVDNEEKLRKYHQFGHNMIGWTHGYHEKYGKLDSLMAYEKPEMWASSTHREWHLGDKHHKVDMLLKTEECDGGVVVRILRSLAPPSVWEYNKAYVSSLKAAEGFLWHRDKGVIAQFTATE